MRVQPEGFHEAARSRELALSMPSFGLNARGTLFTVQKALPLFNDGGSIFMTGSIASVKGFPNRLVGMGYRSVDRVCS